MPLFLNFFSNFVLNILDLSCKNGFGLLHRHVLNGLFGSLEREESRVEEKGYPLSCMDVFKINKGKWSN